MQYHIQTSPIWDAFKSNCDCPLCAIYEKSSTRLVEQYLNEAVMEPDFRVMVNKFGFCSKHLRLLYQGKNKLGLALQLHTRTESVIKQVKVVDNYKQAKSQIETLSKTLDSCVICNAVDEMMQRYAYTIAEMFANETEFPTLFKKGTGFCMPHYILLLKYSNKAGGKITDYLNSLSGVQLSALARINNSTERFTEKFDYRNAGSSCTPDYETIPAAIKILKGRILDEKK